MSLLASRTIFRAREVVARLLGVRDSSRIAFTQNVTQALNMALNGFLQPGDHVLTTSLEHNSVMRPLNWLAQAEGIEIETVPLASDGRIDPAGFAARTKANTRLAVLNHASNVVGTICPVADVRKAVGEIPILLDAAQTAGVLPLDGLADLVDLIAFTGHKGLLGPTGTGGLWIRRGLSVKPLVRGGTGSRSEFEEHPDFMPDCLEAGTPNTHGLAGLAAGIEFVMGIGLEQIRAHEIRLTRQFLDGLSQIDSATEYGLPEAESRVAVMSVNLNGWSPSDLARTLEHDYGILTRTGLHCAPRAHRSLGTFPRGTVRFSFGWFNTEAQVEAVLAALDRIGMDRD